MVRRNKFVAGVSLAPKDNGRVTQGSHDRLIFNDAGETVKAIALHRGAVRVQVMGFTNVTHMNHGTTVEVDLGKREAQALIMQLATALGLGCELMEVGPLTASLMSDQIATRGNRTARIVANLLQYARDKGFDPCDQPVSDNTLELMHSEELNGAKFDDIYPHVMSWILGNPKA